MPHPSLRLLLAAPLLLALPLLATRAGAQVKRVTRPLLRPDHFQGQRFFPSLKWRVTLGMTAHSVPAIADLDLDGRTDILLPAADGNLYRLTDDGNVVWRAALTPRKDPVEDLTTEEEEGPAAPEGAEPPADPEKGDKGEESGDAAEEPGDGVPTVGVTLGDVDRDGALDILVGAGDSLLCLDADGKERWNVTLKEPVNSVPTVADLDADGSPEILFGSNDNRLHVLTSAGKRKWSYLTKSWIVGGAAAADLDGDGKLEVVFGSMDYKLYCLDSTGKLQWEFETGDWIQSSPVIADVDRDGGRDVVVASDDGTLYCLSRKGLLKWKEQFSGQVRLRAYPALSDLDGDGTLETILALPDGQVMVYTAFGDRAWSRSVGAGVRGSPVVADLNGDGWQDILLATAQGQIMALDTWGSPQWQQFLGHTIETTPVLDDLDRDGKYEIYLANLIAPARKIGFFSQYEISVKGGRGSWIALKGDPYRTGFAPNARDYAAALQRGSDYATAWEPFLAGYRPRTGVQLPRRLRITALPLDDRRGNHDGALDPGETAIFRVQVANDGRGASYDSLLSVRFGESPLKLDRDSVYLGWIAPRATKTVTFRLQAPPLAQAAKGGFRGAVGAAVARMQVRESGVQAAVSEARLVKVPPMPAVVSIRGAQIIDSRGAAVSGNGNHRLDAGESVLLRLRLHNGSLTTADRATARLTSGSPDVLVATPTASLGKLVPFAARSADFSLRVARQVQGSSVKLTLTTQAHAAPPHVEQLTLPLRRGPVDVSPPQIALTSPAARIATTRQDHITVAGTVADGSGIAAFRFERQPVPLADLKPLGPGRYRFSLERPLEVGENVFPITAADGAGNTVTLWVRVVRRP